MRASTGPRVLCVDDDRDIAEIVQAVLTDEGYSVSCLYSTEGNVLERTIGKLEPDCVLLDSGTSSGYDQAWREAADMATRHRRVPTIMFTAHDLDAEEARQGTSDRAAAAAFAAVLEKPFPLDDLLAAVEKATGESVPFDRSAAGEKQRTSELVAALRKRGATEIETSKRREWATFRDRHGDTWHMYWWQGRGVYQIGRFGPDRTMQMIGQFVDRDAAILAALP